MQYYIKLAGGQPIAVTDNSTIRPGNPTKRSEFEVHVAAGGAETRESFEAKICAEGALASIDFWAEERAEDGTTTEKFRYPPLQNYHYIRRKPAEEKVTSTNLADGTVQDTTHYVAVLEQYTALEQKLIAAGIPL